MYKILYIQCIHSFSKNVDNFVYSTKTIFLQNKLFYTLINVQKRIFITSG